MTSKLRYRAYHRAYIVPHVPHDVSCNMGQEADSGQWRGCKASLEANIGAESCDKQAT